MEGFEKINMVMVHLNQRAGFTQCNPYTMDIDRVNRNCYSCGGFGHLARNCKNWKIGNRIGEGRRLEYGQRLRIEGEQEHNNLNRDENLIVLD